MRAVVVSLLIGFAALSGSPAASGAPEVPRLDRAAVEGASPTTTTQPPAPRSPDIIPEPNSGTEPTDAGDRGGALQSAVFVVIVGGVVLIGALAYRESRRARADRTASDRRGSGGNARIT